MTDKKRTFTPEYKAECVGLVRDGERSISAVARDLGLSESALRRWVVQSETDAGRGDEKALTTPERAELAQLRRENRQLRMEREILKKATAFSAAMNRCVVSVHCGREGRVSGDVDEPDITSIAFGILCVAQARRE
jgi:transposase